MAASPSSSSFSVSSSGGSSGFFVSVPSWSVVFPAASASRCPQSPRAPHLWVLSGHIITLSVGHGVDGFVGDLVGVAVFSAGRVRFRGGPVVCGVIRRFGRCLFGRGVRTWVGGGVSSAEGVSSGEGVWSANIVQSRWLLRTGRVDVRTTPGVGQMLVSGGGGRKRRGRTWGCVVSESVTEGIGHRPGEEGCTVCGVRSAPCDPTRGDPR